MRRRGERFPLADLADVGRDGSSSSTVVVFGSQAYQFAFVPMRAPPVRSYIHIALPNARATFGLMSPSFERIGIKNGRIFTRWGAFRRSRCRSASAS